jgi:division protein CdvB (Snf7/Vps24/ESCRT-III family)
MDSKYNWDGSSLFGRRTFFQVFKEKMLRKKPPVKEVLYNSLYELDTQLSKLRHADTGMRRRDKMFFEKCVESQVKGDNIHSVMYANECAELRRMIQTIYSSELAIEQAILRLQTIEELGDVILALDPVLSIIQETKGRLSGIVPSVAGKLDEINGSLQVLVKQIGTTERREIRVQATNEATKILNEANMIAEEKIREKFPQLPELHVVQEKPPDKPKLVPLAATPGGDADPIDNESKILEYVKACDGELVLSQCAADLGLSSDKVKEAIENLVKTGKITLTGS